MSKANKCTNEYCKVSEYSDRENACLPLADQPCQNGWMEELYRLLFNSGNDAIYVYSIEDGRPQKLIEVNETGLRRLGYSKKELLEMPLDGFVANQIIQSSEWPVFWRRLMTGGSATIESIHVTKAGKKIPVEVNAHLLKCAETVWVIAIVRDVTERQQAQYKLKRQLDFERLISRISVRFINGDIKNIDVDITTSLQEISEFINVDRCFIYHIDENKAEAILTHSWSRPYDGIVIPVTVNLLISPYSGWLSRLEKDEPVYIEEKETAEEDKATLAALGIQSGLIIPMVCDGRFVGVLGYSHTGEAKERNTRKVALFQIVGGIFASVMRRKLEMTNTERSEASDKCPNTIYCDGQKLRPKVFSQAMQLALDQARLYHLDRSIPVLIQGETGTGKEVIARIIHYGVNGDTRPFVDINCAAITPSLFESELFGYERGSFTGGLTAGHKGKFDLAEGGTLFLDEVSEIPIELQGKLLRVLEQRNFYRVGGIKKISTNVRIICATNRNLEEAIRNGEFRQDLYYRLRVGHIILPPLRRRPEAIVPLALSFLQESAMKRGKRFKRISEDAARLLNTYEWCGNIRELKNLIEWIVFMFDDEEIKPIHLTPLTQNPEQAPVRANFIQDTASGAVLEDHIEQLVQHALHITAGNKAAAARYLGVSRSSLYRILQRASKM